MKKFNVKNEQKELFNTFLFSFQAIEKLYFHFSKKIENNNDFFRLNYYYFWIMICKYLNNIHHYFLRYDVFIYGEDFSDGFQKEIFQLIKRDLYNTTVINIVSEINLIDFLFQSSNSIKYFLEFNDFDITIFEDGYLNQLNEIFLDLKSILNKISILINSNYYLIESIQYELFDFKNE